MRHTYHTLNDCEMQHNAKVGLFTRPSKIVKYNVMYVMQFMEGTNTAQMIYKQVYIEPAQDSILKQLARMLGMKDAEVIRRAIDWQIALLSPGFHDLEAWMWKNFKQKILHN